MDFIKKCKSLKQEVLKSIEDAARSNDTAKIVANSRILEDIECLSKKCDTLKEELECLNGRFYLKPECLSESNKILLKQKNKSGLSAKAQGTMRRQAFVQKAKDKGINLTLIKGVKYKSDRHALLGIASATEKNTDRWFLGLPVADYDTAVLLCQDGSGKIFEFILTKQLMEEISSKLSISNGQYKFNVNRKFDHFYLLVPKIGSKDIIPMLGEFGNL